MSPHEKNKKRADAIRSMRSDSQANTNCDASRSMEEDQHDFTRLRQSIGNITTLSQQHFTGIESQPNAMLHGPTQRLQMADAQFSIPREHPAWAARSSRMQNQTERNISNVANANNSNGFNLNGGQNATINGNGNQSSLQQTDQYHAHHIEMLMNHQMRSARGEGQQHIYAQVPIDVNADVSAGPPMTILETTQMMRVAHQMNINERRQNDLHQKNIQNSTASAGVLNAQLHVEQLLRSSKVKTNHHQHAIDVNAGLVENDMSIIDLVQNPNATGTFHNQDMPASTGTWRNARNAHIDNGFQVNNMSQSHDNKPTHHNNQPMNAKGRSDPEKTCKEQSQFSTDHRREGGINNTTKMDTNLAVSSDARSERHQGGSPGIPTLQRPKGTPPLKRPLSQGMSKIVNGSVSISRSNGEDSGSKRRRFPSKQNSVAAKSKMKNQRRGNGPIKKLKKKVNMNTAFIKKWLKEKGRYPSEEERMQLSDKFGASERQIKVLFTNYRVQELWGKESKNKKGARRSKKDKDSCIVRYNSNLLKNKKINYLEESFSVLREAIDYSTNAGQANKNELLYPNAPLAELWLKTYDGGGGPDSPTIAKWRIKGKHALTADHTLLGRRWIWDEGHFTDGFCHTSTVDVEEKDAVSEDKDEFVPINLRAYCNCGRAHSSADSQNVANPSRQERGARRNARSGTSVKISSVISELANDSLNPHTLISCDDYTAGPECRYLIDPDDDDPKALVRKAEESQELLDEYASNVNLDSSEIQPFDVKVCPDVAFITDLHSHVSNSEVIGLLGGKYDHVEKCLYIQAAFPCKSTERADGGFTDVEMDPVSQAVTGEAIGQHGMKLVGWYHSHPTFQPDPSVTDIKNQERFQMSMDHPFVGLIVGTYDSVNPSSQSIMRWFHVAEKKRDSLAYSSSRNTAKKPRSDGVNYPMKLKATQRKARKYQSDNDPSKIVERKKELSKHGDAYRHKKDMETLTSTLKALRKKSMFTSDSPLKTFCGVIGGGSKMIHTISDITTTTDSVSIVNANTTKFDERVVNSSIMAYYAQGENEVLKSRTQTFSDQVLALEVMYGSIEAPLKISRKSVVSNLVDDSALPYTREDFQLLKSTQVSNDVRAAVIWHAIEREQIHGEVQIPESAPPSSATIMTRLYNSKVFGDEAASTLQRKAFISDDDAMIIHSADAIFNHYMKDLNKIDPFECSKFSLDATSAMMNTNLPGYVKEYFKLTIAESMQVCKMKFGHKITSSLLTSASHMHLNFRSRLLSNCTFDEYVDDSDDVELSSDIEFVSDIMRLLAARWREEAAINGETLKSKSRREVKKTGPKANGVVGTKRKMKSDPTSKKMKPKKNPSKLEIGLKQQARGKKPKRNRKGRYKVVGSS